MCDFCTNIEHRFPNVSLEDAAQYNVLQDRHYKKIDVVGEVDTTSLLIAFPTELTAFNFACKLIKHDFDIVGKEVSVDITPLQLFQQFDWLFHMSSPILIDGESGYALRYRLDF